MIEIKNISKSYGSHQVINGLDLSLKQGIYGIIGPNGSGKTTLLKSILNMVNIEKGEIWVNQQNIKNNWKYKSQISYLPQTPNYPNNLTVNELITFISNIKKNNHLPDEIIELLKLKPYLNKKLNNLSGGTKQKVNVLLCFMYDSEIFILDEPTNGLDPLATQTLLKLILGKKDKLILVTSHISSFIENIADEIIFLLEGKKYYQGSLENLKIQTQQSNLENSIAHLLKNAQK